MKQQGEDKTQAVVPRGNIAVRRAECREPGNPQLASQGSVSEDVGDRRFLSPYEYEVTSDALEHGWQSARAHAAALDVDIESLSRDAGRVIGGFVPTRRGPWGRDEPIYRLRSGNPVFQGRMSFKVTLP